MTATLVHISLDVADLDRSVRFYRELLGAAPDKRHDDHARFQPDDVGLVLTLNAAGPATGIQRLSHLGLRVATAGALEDVRRRLAGTALEVTDERETTCCYALQDKLWVTDPDGNAWELYRLLADVPDDAREHGEACDAAASTAGGCCGGG